ncbi:hypothetical protein [Pseudomonas sp. GM17]|uniref:hypothetical protein n=1 Tax=Pseudomonas sp. GM17 TaxID=1144323 RepID=UPI0012F65FB4|nr:hypothetical protein [Pseudomonas sp. GM17]WIE48117.1 hypothetical protein PMI20_020420 [Pseudomonas sp. GM17]
MMGIEWLLGKVDGTKMVRVKIGSATGFGFKGAQARCFQPHHQNTGEKDFI